MNGHSGERRLKQRGAVLIIVLWIIMLLTILLAGHSSNVKTETQIVTDSVGQIRLRAAAEGVINYLSALNHQSSEGLKAKSGQILKLELGGRTVRYRIIPETAFLSLNTASLEVLQRLIEALDDEGGDAESLAAAIIDWRDPDNITLPNGAEAEDYKAMGFAYVPRDGPFQSVEELARVSGMSRSLVEAMEPFVTVFSGSPSIDFQYAPEELKELLEGMIDSAQEVQPAAVKSELTFDNYQSDFVTNMGATDMGVYRVQVEFSENHNQMSQQMEITVSFAPGVSGKPYTIKKWNPYTAHFRLMEE